MAKVVAIVQPEKLKQRIAEAGIPHGVPVRARIPNVTVWGSREGVSLAFCGSGKIRLLKKLPRGAVACPNVALLDVECSWKPLTPLGLCDIGDATGVIYLNGKCELKVEKFVPSLKA